MTDDVVAGVDVRGSGPATRETDLLDPVNAVERVHAIVPAAALFDLGRGGDIAHGMLAATSTRTPAGQWRSYLDWFPSARTTWPDAEPTAGTAEVEETS